MALKRYRERRGGGVLLPEAGARGAAGLDRGGGAAVSLRAHRARRSCSRDAAQLAWIVNLGCIDLHPHPVRAEDLDHPDELRVDLDPGPGVPFPDVREVALVAREVLASTG